MRSSIMVTIALCSVSLILLLIPNSLDWTPQQHHLKDCSKAFLPLVIMMPPMVLCQLIGRQDWSVGAIHALCVLCFNGMWVESGQVELALLGTLMLGYLLGLLNGFLNGFLKLSSTMTSLLTIHFCLFLMVLLPQPTPASGLPQASWEVTTMLILSVYLIFLFLYKYSRLSLVFKALGSDERQAVRSRINVWLPCFFVFCFLGLCNSITVYIQPLNHKECLFLPVELMGLTLLGGCSLKGGKADLSRSAAALLFVFSMCYFSTHQWRGQLLLGWFFSVVFIYALVKTSLGSNKGPRSTFR